jgi:DNA helicase IV
LCQYEIEKVERAARDKLDELSRQIAGETNRQVAALRQKIKMEESDIARSKPFYDDLVKGLSEKYNIPIEGMVIDPENRIIRDMSSSLAKPNPEPKEK